MLDGNRLSVFENFVTDTSLPKFVAEKKKRSLIRGRMPDGTVIEESDFESSDGQIVGWNSGRLMVMPRRQRFFERLWSSFLSFFGYGLSRLQKRYTVQEYFSSVKNSLQELEIVSERALGYERAIASAESAGQHALCERLQDGLRAYRYETQMMSVGITKYISEESMIGLYKMSPVTRLHPKSGGLRLDWVRNFTRKIPQVILDRKIRADELGLFDNYCVLHYDPEAKSFALTEAQRAAKKDPILFGVIRGEAKLYIIGDWVDEICDFDLAALADAIGRDAIREFESFEDNTIVQRV